MKTHRLPLLLLTLAAAVGLAGAERHADRGSNRPLERAASPSTVQGILITASNEPGKTDRRLAQFEPTLRRILRFESYRFVGGGSVAVTGSAKQALDLGAGHQLEVASEGNDGRTVRLRVRWTQNGRTLMNTGLVLRRGVPAVLGGPATGNKDEVYAVILVGQ